MHLAGLVLGSGAPARLRASGAAPLAAPGGHSLGEEREGEGGREREREATRTDLGAGTGIFITPVISLLRARLRSFPSPAALSTLRPVRGGSLAVPGAGVGGGRRWERANGRGSGAEGSCTPTPGARAPGPRTPAVLTRRTAASTGANAAANSAPREPPDSSRGQPLGWGFKCPGSEFSSSRTSAERWRPSNAPSSTQDPVSKFTSPVPSRPDCHHPRPGGPSGTASREGVIPPGEGGIPRPCCKCWPPGTKQGFAAQLGKALVWRAE